jgi:hypothetical protein
MYGRGGMNSAFLSRSDRPGTVRVLLTLLITKRHALDRRNLEAGLRPVHCDWSAGGFAGRGQAVQFMMSPQQICWTLFMANPTGEIGQLREEELPVVRVIVPPDLSGRVFEDDLDPGDLVFDGKLTPMLVWHERYPVGRGWRSGWVLSYDTDGNGNPEDYIVGLGLPDVNAAVAQAREYLRSVGYPAAGWPSS